MKNIDLVLPLLDTPKKIFITTHHKPDGDAMGSSLGLYHFLKSKGHFPVVVSPSEVPDFLQWMPGISEVLNFASEPNTCLKILEDCDLIFCLDFSRLDRIKYMEPHLRKATQTKVLIDHHLNAEYDFFDCGICLPEKSSTCEMVYDFIRLADPLFNWTQEIMQSLYTGLMTDTGSFRFPATAASSHEMAATFIANGLQQNEVHENVYDTSTENRMRLQGFALYEKMELYPQQHVAIIPLSKIELQRFGDVMGDTEGLVNMPLGIEGIKISVLLTERNDEIKLSFRSKGQIDVATFSQQNFNGGGHVNAAGGSSKENMEATVAKLKDLIFKLKY